MTKTCIKCHAVKPIDGFYKHKMMAYGRLSACKECVRIAVRSHYRATIENRRAYEKKRNATDRRKEQQLAAAVKARTRYPKRYGAHQIVAYAIRSGKLIRQPCEVCGATKVQAHHDDYSKQLDVRWLCKPHHDAHHGKTIRAEEIRNQCQTKTEKQSPKL